MKKHDFHKGAGVIIIDKKLLVVREFNEDFFIAPGGRVEGSEKPAQAVIRELKEEIGIDVDEQDLEYFGTYYDEAAGDKGMILKMDAFIVKKWIGSLDHSSEIEEVRWITSKDAQNIKLGSIFQHHVVPSLKEKGLID